METSCCSSHALVSGGDRSVTTSTHVSIETITARLPSLPLDVYG